MRKAPWLIASAAAPLALLVSAGALLGQAIPLDLEVGYRFVDVSGNEREYRTQINDRQGFLLRSLDYTSQGPLGSMLDYFHVDASDVGRGSGRAAAPPGRRDRHVQADLHLARDRPLQRPAGLRQPVPLRGHHPGPAHLQPDAQHLRRHPRASSGQDRSAPSSSTRATSTTDPGRRRTTSAATSS